MQLLGQAFQFPEYYGCNLDSADEILNDIKEEKEVEKLSLQPFFDTLLSEEPEEERRKIWTFLTDHFIVEEKTPEKKPC